MILLFPCLGGFFAEGKTFRTCELARALAGEGIPRVLISNCERENFFKL